MIKRHLLFFTFLILGAALSQQQYQNDFGADYFDNPTTTTPFNYYQNVCPAPPIKAPQKEFVFRSSLFQLFPRVTITCDGYLTKWSFISRNQNGTGMYLSVWRRANASASASYTYRQIGVTRIDNFNVIKDTWTDYEVPRPFPVRGGDIIGLYYQMWQVLWPYSGHVPVTATFSQAPKGLERYYGEALVANYDAGTLADEFLDKGNNVVDMTNSAKVARFPAIQAFVDPDYSPSGPTTTTRRTPSPTQPRPQPTPETGKRNPRLCLSPFKTQGKCNYSRVQLRWFFDTATQLCEMFWHYDCVVSDNIFTGRESCDFHCADLISGKLDANAVNSMPLLNAAQDIIDAYDEIINNNAPKTTTRPPRPSRNDFY